MSAIAENEVSTATKESPPCPRCKTPMSVLWFMGSIPDGWVCPTCRLWFNEKDGKPADKPLAMVI